jgi:hypothetical protein
MYSFEKNKSWVYKNKPTTGSAAFLRAELQQFRNISDQ